MEHLFRFKQFTIQHQRSSMKVGTDAVLLGAWCELDGARRVLDVGTGCGVIALMVAQRTTEADIWAIDIDSASVDEARENFLHSPWSDRLQVRQEDFNNLADADGFDLIVTNPPYYNENVLPPDAVRSAARHTHALSFDQLMRGASARCGHLGSNFCRSEPVTAHDSTFKRGKATQTTPVAMAQTTVRHTARHLNPASEGWHPYTTV